MRSPDTNITSKCTNVIGRFRMSIGPECLANSFEHALTDWVAAAVTAFTFGFM